ncbi:thermonuclease family protein [Paraliomyxa miuraensis]|uniref:thermonuclease family protein n=1 Tax=Paraliomyxa miuraensis TaxID=376150 RepID=UPI00224D99C0|nr:thermonuclease family protein [Paraliomyxa miuraensis]MCX4246435.1 thermonuclease family protein [Paraliomyxa miuraensis]
MPRRRTLEISSNHVYWSVVLALAACTYFFVTNVQQRRGQLQQDHSVQIDSGTRVELVRVIDADEISIRADGSGTFVVRLLGVKGFSTTINEPGVAGLGQAAVATIERTIADKELRVVFDELAFDRSGRLLTYIEADGQDLGQLLVQRGHLVTYTRYPFSREGAYLGAEAEARTKKAGLWGNYKAVARVQGWQDTWKTARDAEAEEP